MPASTKHLLVAGLIGLTTASGCSTTAPSIAHRDVPRNIESTISAFGMWGPDDCIYMRPEIVITSMPGHGEATISDKPASQFPHILKESNNCIDPDQLIKVLTYRPKDGYIGADQIEFYVHSFEGDGTDAFRLILSIK